MTFRLPQISLHPWQRRALAAWMGAGKRGIVAAATGSGKTLLALHAMSESRADRVVVVVPTQVLQHQWLKTLRTTLGLSPRFLGTIGGTNSDFKVQHHVVVAVINSARAGLSNVIQYWHSIGDQVLLVVDECHWAGSETSAHLFEEAPESTLGLSATPERSDDGFDTLLVPNLGKVVFRYQLRDAMDDGILSEIKSSHLFFTLPPFEQTEIERLTNRISLLRHQISNRHPELGTGPGWPDRLAKLTKQDPNAQRLAALLQKRRHTVASAPQRIDTLGALVRSGYLDARRTIIFNETIDQAKRVGSMLEEEQRSHVLEHSQLPDMVRQSALRRFASGSVPTIVAVKALDEGIDVPDANTAVIVSGSLSPRQRIQRIGRVARASSTPAEVISLLARDSPDQWEIAANDARLLGAKRVRELDLAKRE